MKRIRSLFNTCVSRLKDLLFPPRCICCSELLPWGSEEMCDDCRLEYENAKLFECGECGKPLPLCDCVYREYQAKRIRGFLKLYVYDPHTPASAENLLIYRVKNKNLYAAHRFLAKELSKGVMRTTIGNQEDWYLTFPPRSRRAIHKYGFDHMKAFAAVCSREWGIQLCDCFRRRGGRIQKGLHGADARIKNATASYALKRNVSLSGRRFIIIDDVVTSGATLRRCSELLYGAGAKCVVWVSIAMTKRKKTDF